MKKYLALLLTVILCFGVFAMPTFSAFTDVDEEHRHLQSISYLTEKGVINGYEDGSFKPENTITRAEFLKMLLEFLGFGNVYGDAIVKTGFSDVDAKIMEVTSKDEEGNQETNSTYTKQHWATGYIKLAVDKGVVNGYGDGKFGPDDPVKYEEAIKMVVCCLGREEHAMNKAQSIGVNLWPDGYLSIGNDLMISKSTEYLLGGNASRSNVAQMLYNVKDVQVYVAPNVNICGVSAGGGGGGVGAGGSSGGNVENNTTVVSGLITYGQMVAAVKSAGGTNKEISIDPNVSAINKYITLKLETPINGNDYMSFYTSGTDYSHYLGYRVQLKYRFNPDGGVKGRYEVEVVAPKDTSAVSINSNQFKKDKTDNKNLTETDVHVCYTDGNEDYYQSFYTDDLDTLTVIYNNKVIDVESLGNDPAVKSDIITLSDLMPANGSIKIVDADEDTEIDVVWVESYETYVAGTLNYNTNPKSIKDKFRTTRNADGDEIPVTLVLDETDPTVDLKIVKGGSEKEVTDIKANDLLKVAQSKCGKNIDVTVETVTAVSNKKYESAKTENGVKTGIKMDDGKTYELTDYFRTYVDSSLEYEAGDTLTLYLNSKNEVVWATVKEVSYSTGYLIKATYSEQNEELLLDILTSSGTITKFKMADSKTKYITKANACLDGFTGTANANGTLYKNLPEDEIFNSLKENADIINYGLFEGTGDDKPSDILVNAATAQPIMYTVASGTTLSHLVTLEPDMDNRFTGTKLQYVENDAGGYSFGNTFSAPSGAIFIFVPNSRDDKSTNYKIGTAASLSKKLIPYAYYNIEPYYFTNAAGTRSRNVFVVYNQSIDAIPTYRSENMIISSIVPNLGSNDVVTYTINGYVASNSSTKSYKVENGAVLNAYVLDENFNRTGAREEIAVGDVIRVGFGSSGSVVASIDLILDASEAQKALAPKAMAARVDGTSYELATETPRSYEVSYYARIGKVTAIDASDVKEWCEIEISDTKTDRLNIGTGYSSKQILMYDYRAEDLPSTENKDERLKTATMDDLWGDEMLYIWQGEKLAIKQIYAIRYPEVQQ